MFRVLPVIITAHELPVINLDDTPGTAFKVFSLMAKHHVNIDIILQSVGRDNKKSISFTIRQDDAERVECYPARREGDARL